MKPAVAIVGAGVSGLTCAVCLAEAGFRTKIFAEEIGPATTSAAAGAIWFPYDVLPAEAAIAWSLTTFAAFRDLSGIDGSGVSMIELHTCSRAGEIAIPAWALPLGAQRLEAGVIPPCFSSGFRLQVPLVDTTIYLDYLLARYRHSGGDLEKDISFARLEDVSRRFDLVVNCAGIGARTLVPDLELEPHRGQVVLVAKLALAHAIVCDDPPLMYAFPRRDDCVFGGSNDISSDRKPDAALSQRIRAECSQVLGIAPQPILSERVGLRPFRSSGICLRRDRLSDGRAVIHNYGHGGAGFTVSWGCAREVLALSNGQA